MGTDGTYPDYFLLACLALPKKPVNIPSVPGFPLSPVFRPGYTVKDETGEFTINWSTMR